MREEKKRIRYIQDEREKESKKEEREEKCGEA